MYKRKNKIKIRISPFFGSFNLDTCFVHKQYHISFMCRHSGRFFVKWDSVKPSQSIKRAWETQWKDLFGFSWEFKIISAIHNGCVRERKVQSPEEKPFHPGNQVSWTERGCFWGHCRDGPIRWVDRMSYLLLHLDNKEIPTIIQFSSSSSLQISLQ